MANWLTTHFPEAELRDVAGLVKLVGVDELKDNDWSLSPTNYVGLAPLEEDENFDFKDTMREIHMKLKGLNDEAIILATTIENNFKELGI